MLRGDLNNAITFLGGDPGCAIVFGGDLHCAFATAEEWRWG